MRDELERIGVLGDPDIAVVVVTFASSDHLKVYRTHLRIPFTILSDPTRETYAVYGLTRAPLRKIYRPATLRAYIRLLRQGRKLERPDGDTRQLGGDFVVGLDGRLRLAHRPVAPDDRPSPDELLAALASAADPL